MVFSELASRLNDVGYKNWMKAGYCLLKLRNGLKELVSVEMSVFHQNLIKQNTVLRAGCIGGCKPRGKQFHPNCSVCREWRNEILSHHTNRNGEINWGNCRPWLWSSEHWEVAKAYMPRGSADIQGPDKCDAAALLNLIGFCDHFRFVSQQKVREVIKSRNELMHSSEMSVSSAWIDEYALKIHDLLNEFRCVPEVKEAAIEIKKILSSDWAVVLSGRDDVDGIPNMSNEDEAVQISTMEIELLKEKLQEILLDKQDVLCEEDISRIGKFRCFLEGSKDLGSHFHAAIQRLLNLEQKKEHKHQRSNSNDIEAEKHTEDEKSEVM
ncbi:uncharacterized protein CXorf38-like isoform X2 [Protopterus annectens]|uniref:uncharacterized protein CXorf38-like isoform X2 n=1 Tax=Protopterus annectens TaxID=7888 RepID=UPI001CFC3DFB|nr:uncharacterized protein CXorf38-like isoform X2 [Protopterus annectens]